MAMAAPSTDEGLAIELAGAARRGERAGIDGFVRWAWDRAYRTALLITQDEGAAEDASQDAVVRAVAALERVDTSRPLGPWVERIAANRSIDWLRRQSSRPELPLLDGDLEDSSELVDATADAVAASLSEDVMAALRSLSHEQRTAVVLRHLLNYSPSEIAELVDASPAAVRTRIHRGLLALRNILHTSERTAA